MCCNKIDRMNLQNFYVSIHCLTCNQAAFVEDAMDGFCNQQTTFPYIAFIIDDASTDGEQKVIKQYLVDNFENTELSGYREWETDEAYFIFARHKQNNQCSFLAIFLKTNYFSQKKDKEHFYKDLESNVKYVAYCDGDDYWTDSMKLEKQVKALQSHPECSFCVSDYTEYFQNEMKYREHRFPIDFQGKTELVLDMHYYLTGPFFTKDLSVMWVKDALLSSNFFKYDVQYDMPMFFALFTQGKGLLMKDVFGCYRRQDGGIYAGVDRTPFLNDFFSNIYSICREEKTRTAQQFVYNFVAPYALSELIRQKGLFVKNCLKYLGFYGLKLIFYKIPQLVFSILLGKIGIKVKPDYLRV